MPSAYLCRRAGERLRLIGLELERMLAHIADVGALCGDVAFVVPAAYTARLKESLLQASARFFGTRCWRGLALPGGMKRDLTREDARALGASRRRSGTATLPSWRG